MRAEGIPYDVQWGDIDYMDEKKDFTYDPVNFAGLPEFINELHSNGMKYIVILDPGIKIEEGYKAYDEGMEQNVFITMQDGITPVETEVWPGATYHPDYTHPNVTQWWTDQCRDLYDTFNITYDALWVDMNEPANFQPDDPAKLAKMNCTGKYNFPPYMPRILGYDKGLHDKSICMDNQHYGGVLHYNVHSLYGHTMSTTTHATLQELMPTKRSLVLTRSSYPGTGKYAATWTGDNQSYWSQLHDSITAIIEHNLFGFAMVGADICGFWGEPTLELCLRWMQVGAFYPFSRNHNADSWPPQEPTAFNDETMTDVSRSVLLTRYQLIPFMYTQFYLANLNGGTHTRSLAHEFPTDLHTRDINTQFLIGSCFMVTPVVEEGATNVMGYFPAQSRWFDFYTGKEIESSGKFIKLDAPLEHINLHVRGGYVIPMQEPSVTTALSRNNPMKLLIALDTNYEATGTLYWDDGESRDPGENYALLQFTCAENKLTISIDHSPSGSIDGFDELIYDEIWVMGLNEAITSVTADGSDVSTIEVTSDNLVKISSLSLKVNAGHEIEW